MSRWTVGGEEATNQPTHERGLPTRDDIMRYLPAFAAAAAIAAAYLYSTGKLQPSERSNGSGIADTVKRAVSGDEDEVDDEDEDDPYRDRRAFVRSGGARSGGGYWSRHDADDDTGRVGKRSARRYR